jgi:hypothetical protein
MTAVASTRLLAPVFKRFASRFLTSVRDRGFFASTAMPSPNCQPVKAVLDF